METLDKQQIGENRTRRLLRGAEERPRVDRRRPLDQNLPYSPQQLTAHKKRQHCEMERIQPSQPQEKKPSDPEAVAQSLLVVRGDDKAAQDEKEIDEEPGVAQEGHAVQMAVGVQMEQGHQARSDAAPTIQYQESSHVRSECLVLLAGPPSGPHHPPQFP